MARRRGMPCCTTPIARPPTMLTAVMITPATASPRTNRLAPSMAAKKSAWRWTSRRAARASSRERAPAWTSASIAICRPGSPSSVNRAATSLVRVDPAVMTTNWMTAMIAKITPPTTRSLAATNSPNAFTTSPAASAPSMAARDSTSRVVATLRTRRTSVETRRKVGKMLNSSGVRAAIAPSRASTESVRLAARRMSRMAAGTGAMITITASRIPIGTTQSRACQRSAVGVGGVVMAAFLGRGGDDSGGQRSGPDRSRRHNSL